MRRFPRHIPDLLWGPVTTGGLVLAAGALGLAVGQPLLFPSLGPTAVLYADFPAHSSARPYNTLVGHLVGLGSGYLAVFLASAQAAPAVLATHELAPSRVVAGTLAVTLTWVILWAIHAPHPPAAATTLLAALGGFRPIAEDALAVIIGVLVVAVLGQALRWARGRYRRPIEPSRAGGAAP